MIPGTRYRILRQIGAGGMSTVYEVEHIELGKSFVLKLLLSELSKRTDLMQRVRNEWRALGRLRHPNVVTVTDAGETEAGLPYFVMERLEGETLAQLLKRRRSLSVPEALEIAHQLLDGLSAAHALGIVHRDIKPANIFLPEGAPLKLLDFGIAKLEDGAACGVTREGVTLGTPRYMSPEQALGERLDRRADLYCVGLLLFEMVAGRSAFARAKRASEVLAAQISEVPPALCKVVPGVASELSRLVAALLEKDPGRRPSSARSVMLELSCLLERYTRQISTTEITRAVRYSTASAPAPDAVPPSVTAETLEGIPWTVDAPSPNPLAAFRFTTEKGMPWTLTGTSLEEARATTLVFAEANTEPLDTRLTRTQAESGPVDSSAADTPPPVVRALVEQVRDGPTWGKYLLASVALAAFALGVAGAIAFVLLSHAEASGAERAQHSPAPELVRPPREPVGEKPNGVVRRRTVRVASSPGPGLDAASTAGTGASPASQEPSTPTAQQPRPRLAAISALASADPEPVPPRDALPLSGL